MFLTMSSAALPLEQLDWGTLMDQIAAKVCTPFIGAGACVPRLPLAGELARRLVERDEREFGRTCPLPNPSDLQKVCQYLAVTHEEGDWPKRKIAEIISAVDPPDFNSDNDPHRALAALKLPVYITTNYDRFMYGALSQMEDVHPRIEFSRWTEDLLEGDPSEFDKGYNPSPAEPVVFHLHGHCARPETMVASEDDYLDFIVRISKEWAGSAGGIGQRAILPTRIRAALKSSTLLFLGYSLEDVNFRVILRGLLANLAVSRRRTSIAIQYSGDKTGNLQAYLAQYFKWSLNLAVYYGTPAEFAERAMQEWRRYSERRPAARAATVQG